MSAANPHNVDICVTCICDKPPTLPLREELPSLGIEVIYNAKGVGAEATEKELKKQREKIKRQRMNKLLKNKKKDKDGSNRSRRSTLNPPGTFLSKNFRKAGKQKEDPPEDLAIPKALSYGSYQRTLDIRTNEETKSITSSIETSSSMDERDRSYAKKKKKLARRLRGLFSEKKDPNQLPTSVKFPNSQNLEEAALEEAFNAFMADEDINIPSKPIDIEIKKRKSTGMKNVFPDLLPGGIDNPKGVEKDGDENLKKSNDPQNDRNHSKGVSDSSSSGIEQTTVSSLGNDSSIVNKNLIYDAEAFSKQARNYLNKLTTNHGKSPVKVAKDVPSVGNIKVKLLGNRADDHITEIYDLTQIPEVGNEYLRRNDKHHLLSSSQNNPPGLFQDDDWNNVVYHGSKVPISPHLTNQNDRSEYSEESSVPVPQMQDGFGKNILDVSNVYEENGPGSPLVLSPVPRRDNDYIDLLSSSFDISNYGQDKKKSNPYLPSFVSDPIGDNQFTQDVRDDIVVYRAECDMSLSFRERNLSPLKLDVASAYRAPTKRALESVVRGDLSKISPEMEKQRLNKATTRFKEAQHRTPSLRSSQLPTIRYNTSRDSHESLKSPKVSFSEDIEERHYFKKEKFEYEKSLAAIVNEGQELNEPLPSALSREADEAFQSFADQLDERESPRTPEQILLEALSYGDPLPYDFEETIKLNPSIASQRLPDIDTSALHSACLRAFPKRFSSDHSCRVMDLVNDLHLHRKLIEALVVADRKTCRQVDSNGDLPVHIMARHLMEWEGRWYQKVYNRATGQEDDQDNGAGITRLYQSMSECINILLEPVIESDSLCLQPGSVGRILPLHIAAIFTVPYNTLRSLTEACPNAASIRCDLSDVNTFVPNNSTPLELHDRLSTDFPKWEIQRVNVDPGEEMTQAMIDKVYMTTNGIRRSDLMFAFSPNLLPYRKEAHRIQRMEKMIQKEMQDQEKNDEFVLTRKAEVFWIWLCQFQDHDDLSDHYAESISRIINSLSFHSVRYLASVLNEGGNPVLDKAIPSCADAIMKRLDTIAKTQIAIRVRTLASNPNMMSRGSLLGQFDDETSKRFSLHGQGLVGPICRSIFNITETAYPSSFVILPYKLVKDTEGRLGLESPEAAKAAMKFAEFLSTLTTPKNIIGTLDQKIEETVGQNLVDKMNRASRVARGKYFTEFLKLYENQTAYFYFIDDCSGVPIVDERRGIYPLIISDAAEVIEKVFPMMLSGMILMRGDKSIPILVDVLLDNTIKVVLPSWIEAAKDLISYIFSSNSDSANPILQVLLPVQDRLLEFVQYGPTENKATDKLRSDGLSNEWVVELSLIKMILEMHDPRHYFCDLSKERATSQVMWTKKSNVLNRAENRIDFVSIETLKDRIWRYGQRVSQKMTKENEVYSHRVLKGNFVPSDTTNEINTNRDRNTAESDYSSDAFTDATSDDEMPGMIITTAKMMDSDIVKSDVLDHLGDCDSYSNGEQQYSSQDDSFNLDSVVELRLKLDQQEAKLYSLRQKISYLDNAGDELEQGEEKITNMINEIINQKDILHIPSRDGLKKAKALLLRICELEDRVLCREIEVGQLKNDVSFFELEASNHNQTESGRIDEKLSFSSHQEETHSQDEISGPLNEGQDEILERVNEVIRTHDTDIESMASDQNFDLNQVTVLNGVNDDSTAGNSTMYNSSIDGYSAGFSAGLSRY
mmetsp:Transcript_16090/g.37296  ORF Transcript_16090/g.37296 Transcript_16090/m.37296 type:complete len:1699 (+) Transcript_16090:225-5321(+)|eukprot:CAMPEP_0197190866 /NCGR_PEP_ID=MMETSP1423-20130617/22402_1 /TAXON_ID=476441 /ORGANISM="Pseudo-nitzschia heimii, Strain UNC1101" /LENGTH=1698 /DNA_ID=CAMNT_0042643343 /DNA_START=158 /DNA_END=5254 /DNA_ORIENTATION=+